MTFQQSVFTCLLLQLLTIPSVSSLATIPFNRILDTAIRPASPQTNAGVGELSLAVESTVSSSGSIEEDRFEYDEDARFEYDEAVTYDVDAEFQLSAEQSRVLCNVAGLSSACGPLYPTAVAPVQNYVAGSADDPRLKALRSTAATGSVDPLPAVRSGTRRQRSLANADMILENESSEGCPAGGQVVFAHVMKTAGSAVDAFLSCRSFAEGWSVFHADGQYHWKAPADSKCAPSVCTLHGPVINRDWDLYCGSSFANARVFTVLRDPIARVNSFYNYLRLKKYKPYLQNSLDEVLWAIGRTDFDAQLDPKGRCEYCTRQLSSPMVLYNFQGANTSKALWKCKGSWPCIWEESLLQTALAEAKTVLGNMAAVFFVDDMPQFAELFDNDEALSPAPVDTSADCIISSVNKAEHEAPSTYTTNLIKQLNAADIALYEYAKTLPNTASSKAAQALMTPEQWQRLAEAH